MLRPRFWLIFLAGMALGAPLPKVLGATYYVAQNQPQANDANPGTEVQPWRTIQRAGDVMVAGDTTIVKQGTYLETVVPAHSGTLGNLITFKGDPAGMPKIDGRNNTNRAFNLTKFQNYIRIEGFEMTGHNDSAVYIASIGAGIGCQVVNNVIHDFNGKAVYLRYGRDLLVEGNHCYNAGYNIINVDGTDVTIRGNHIHDGQADGIAGGGSGTLTIENNFIHGFTSAVTHGDCIQIQGVDGTFIVRGNIVTGGTQDIFFDPYSNPPGISPAGDVYIYNNIVYGPIFQNGIVIDLRFNSIDSLHVFNNTLVDLNSGSGGLRVFNDGSPFRVGTTEIKNNIFLNAINEAQVSVCGDLSTDNNIYYNETRAWYLDGFVNLDQWRALHPTLEVHSSEQLPVFVDRAGRDFHLLNTSPAFNTGTELLPVGNIHFDTDRDGVPRPQFGLWDVGAYEYTGIGTPVGKVATPTIDPNGAVYSVLQVVHLHTATPGATIRYTTDGSTPNFTSTAYNGSELVVAFIGTLKVRASASGMIDSDVASALFIDTSYKETTPPTVILNTPFQGQTARGVVRLRATATDNIAVQDVTFRVNGVALGVPVTAPPYEMNWDTRGLDNVSYTITARATDYRDNFAISAPATVLVDNLHVDPPPPSGFLVASYTFDEGQGIQVKDSSIFKNDGELTGGTWVPEGKFGGALAFDGSSTWVSVPNSPSLLLSSGMTLEAWIKPSQPATSWQSIVAKERDDSGFVYWLSAQSPSGPPAGGGAFGLTDELLYGDAAVQPGEWTYVAITYDGTAMNLYVNDVQVSSIPESGDLQSSSDPLRIGGNAVSGNNFAGLIDELRIYNYALTPGQIHLDSLRSASVIHPAAAQGWQEYQ